ncbi:MAG: hypothetical protein NXI22_03880, partial [bacterium]|nr:hypothetical protein [bacterium]
MPGPAEFNLNMAYVRKMERSVDDDYQFETEQTRDIANIVESLFGTPDDPHLPRFLDESTGEPVLADIIDKGWLDMAAGEVSSDENGMATGVYREHCVH